MELNCKHVWRYISDYLDDSVDPELRADDTVLIDLTPLEYTRKDNGTNNLNGNNSGAAGNSASGVNGVNGVNGANAIPGVDALSANSGGNVPANLA